MKRIPVVIYGAGGFAREVAWLAQDAKLPNERYEVVAFIDDNAAHWGQILNGIPVMGLESTYQQFPDARVVGGIGIPKVRQKVIEKARAMGFEPQTLMHPRVEISEWVNIGAGSIICAGNIITTNITLGQQVHLNLDCTIGHDAILDDYTTLAPGVHVSGWVHIGKRVYIGTGANIVNGTQDAPIVLADDTIVGAGACVTKSITEPGLTVVGVPARPLKK